ncbi:MAG: FAD-dependent oxidoreductase [Gammaproteobacteria bacterium]|nr:FAD-dependent oxidoreductase [Gammaproteobacteria bacterium]
MSDGACIIIGASHSGVSMAMQLRKQRWSGDIKIIGAEKELPYHRPPLSKEYLSGEKRLEDISLRPKKLFKENGIKLSLGVSVLSIDRNAKKISTSNGEQLSYEKLALCTGASANRLPIENNLDNIFYLRTASDVCGISSALPGKKRVVIIGAGYIGLESAAVFRKMGLKVTVIESAERILARVTSALMSTYIQSLHEKEGVEFRLRCSVKKIMGHGTVNSVSTDSGEEILADMVLIGVGITPNIRLAKDAGLQVDRGILVNQYCETNDPEIYAAGDCTQFTSHIYNQSIRLESVQNANDQGKCAAANISGSQKRYESVPWFWSNQYNAKIQMAGLNLNFTEIVTRGSLSEGAERGFVLFYLQNSRVLAADCVDRPKEFLISKNLIKNKSRVPNAVLANDSIDPIDFQKYLY